MGIGLALPVSLGHVSHILLSSLTLVPQNILSAAGCAEHCAGGGWENVKPGGGSTLGAASAAAPIASCTRQQTACGPQERSEAPPTPAGGGAVSAWLLPSLRACVRGQLQSTPAHGSGLSCATTEAISHSGGLLDKSDAKGKHGCLLGSPRQSVKEAAHQAGLPQDAVLPYPRLC